MKKLISIIIFTLITFFGSNFLLYCFNTTNFLFINEYKISSFFLINLIYLLSISIIIIGLLLIINNKIFIYYDKPRYYLILSLINSILFFLINIYFLKKDKLININNILSIILTIFLTTYTFYYSIYYFSLLKYKGNRRNYGKRNRSKTR